MTGLIDGLWDVALLGGHRRDQVRNISTDVLRQVIKVAVVGRADRGTAPAPRCRPGHPRSGGEPADED
jgi:hypothetical protein